MQAPLPAKFGNPALPSQLGRLVLEDTKMHGDGDAWGQGKSCLRQRRRTEAERTGGEHERAESLQSFSRLGWQAPVRSLARARCRQKMGFAKFPLHVALAIPDCPDADRTQSGPWRRASDRASKVSFSPQHLGGYRTEWPGDSS